MNNTDNQPDIVAGYLDDYKQTQKEIFRMDAIKVRNSIFWIAGLLFGSSLLGLATSNLITSETILFALIDPAIFVVFGFLAIKQPMIAIILSVLLFVAIIVITISTYGRRAAISGILVKAIIIYFHFAGFKSARTAEKARKETA
jgi:Ca2+/Na+ antiporter